MTRFAENTSVPVERSRAEIESLLTKYGADEFGSIRRADHSAVMFRINGLLVQFVLPTPTRKDVATQDRYGRDRSETTIDADLAQETRRRWRALALMVKAKLEAVATKITTVEREFLAYVVMSDGRAFGDVAIPRLIAAAAAGEMPIGIPFLGGPKA